MKTCKKLFTLALALILLMSVLVLPAMAEAEASHVHAETIQPRVPYTECVYCGSRNARWVGSSTDANGKPCGLYECLSCGKSFKM